MAYCTDCGLAQSRLKKGLKCNECFNKLNKNIVKRKIANTQNKNGKQM